MSGYHWIMITRLAWFSTLIHLAALSIWPRPVQHISIKRVLRLILMSFLAIMLMAAIMVTADTGFRNHHYAVCYMRVPRPGFNLGDPNVVASGILLISNIVIRLCKIYCITSKSAFTAAKTQILFFIRQTLAWFCICLQNVSLRANLFCFHGLLTASSGFYDIPGNLDVFILFNRF